MSKNPFQSQLTRRDAMRLMGVGAAGIVTSCGGDPGPAVAPVAEPIPPPAPQPIIRTVLGDVMPDELGDGSIVLHEHLSKQQPFPAQREPGETFAPDFTADVEMMTEEIRLAGADGVSCIVDAGHADMDRNLDALRTISTGSGVSVVACGGYWTQASYPPDIATKSVEQLTDELVEEAQREGFGAYGEIGTSAPMTDEERKVLTAVARAHVRTGLPIFTHNPYPGGEPESALRQLDILEAEGVDLDHLVIGHVCCLDQPEAEVAIELAARGASVGFDRVGWLPMLEDTKRAAMIVKIAEAGHADKVLLGSDFFREEQLKTNGGPGYSKSITIMPPLLIEAGLDEATVRGFHTDNPRRWLTHTPVEA